MLTRSYRAGIGVLLLVATFAVPAAANADGLVPDSSTTTYYDQHGNRTGSSVTTPSVIYLDGSTHTDVPTTTSYYDQNGNYTGSSTTSPSVINLNN